MAQLPLPDGRRSEPSPTNVGDNRAAATGRALRVLVVEDQPDIGRVMRVLIERAGHQTQWASTGREALDMARATLPDVALVDIGLPDMNGHELASCMLADPLLKNIALIALTGYGQQDDRLRSYSAGFERHLVKPISADELAMILAECSRGPLSEFRSLMFHGPSEVDSPGSIPSS